MVHGVATDRGADLPQVGHTFGAVATAADGGKSGQEDRREDRDDGDDDEQLGEREAGGGPVGARVHGGRGFYGGAGAVQ